MLPIRSISSHCTSTSAILRRFYAASAAAKYPGVYLHPVKDGNHQFAVSFLNDDSKVKGPAIIGWLNSGSEITPSNFTDNREFIQFMHKVIKDNLVLDPELGHMALLQKTGYMHIQDNRNPPYANRIPETEDIIGSVRLDDGKMVPETYEPMPVHRLVSMNGLFQLNKPLQSALVKALESISK